jgi:hypothetical protein
MTYGISAPVLIQETVAILWVPERGRTQHAARFRISQPSVVNDLPFELSSIRAGRRSGKPLHCPCKNRSGRESTLPQMLPAVSCYAIEQARCPRLSIPIGPTMLHQVADSAHQLTLASTNPSSTPGQQQIRISFLVGPINSLARVISGDPFGFPEEGLGPTSGWQTTDPQSMVAFRRSSFLDDKQLIHAMP